LSSIYNYFLGTSSIGLLLELLVFQSFPISRAAKSFSIELCSLSNAEKYKLSTIISKKSALSKEGADFSYF